MCTVTIIPHGGPGCGSGRGLRMLCNRDESPERAAAMPPRIVEQCGVRWLGPIDPPSRGTWIAAAETGVVATLLNMNPPGGPPTASDHPQSRGVLVPRVIAGGDFEAACDIAETINAARYRPFRLVIADPHHLAVVAGDGNGLTIDHQTLPTRPWLITSSGLGDHRVDPPRRALFNDWFGELAHDWAGEQDRYHRHRWADQPELSVCMQRDGAQTVSLTAVEVDGERVSMRYRGAPPDQPGDEAQMVLQREAGVGG